MFIKLSVILFVLQIGCAQKENQEWELAVVVNDRIEVLQSNGTLIGSTVPQFSSLKALTYDNVRHQFIVSDMDQENDTIYTVRLTQETDITPIITDLPDDVQGLAIDPIEDVLYWTDSLNKTINYVGMNDSNLQPKTLFAFESQEPQNVVIDVCRRYIYWTNSDIYRPSIERSNLDGSKHELLINSDLHMPSGITIDYKEKRLYWADMRAGIYYRIESANLEGKEREIVYEGTHCRPFGIAVDERAIYWTDVNNNALWRYTKRGADTKPEQLRLFDEKPMGLVAKNLQIRSYPDCKELERVVEMYKGPREEVFLKENEDGGRETTVCLNGGVLTDGACKCGKGYTGRFCETQLCYEFCIRGDCHLSSRGYPQCHCPKGFGGMRCEIDMCHDYCLNDGKCSYERGDVLPKCNCSVGFTGRRCEIGVDFSNVCAIYCVDRDNGVLISTDKDMVCRCNKSSYDISTYNLTTARLSQLENSQPSSQLLASNAGNYDYFDRLGRDPAYIVQTSLLVVCVAIIAVLSVYICVNKKKRPRIKKRIIVNKNVTPLTYRPQPTTEHCEITIENCCNMNVCETPCFEPPRLRGKNIEDKKTLLSNMEGSEDF